MKVTLSVPVSPDILAQWCQGRTVATGDAWNTPVSYVCTDSREASFGTLFCAIRGERVDGHEYIARAYEAGCRHFLCERESPYLQTVAEPAVQIVVRDTVAALSPMAAAFRENTYPHMKTVAVTGSVGKTTTKECVAAVLRAGGESFFCKEGNYNSTIGLPLSMLEIPQDTCRAVLEMGMSARGEIHAMSVAAAPYVGIITNVGSSHMEYLGSRENIAAAKLEICDGLEEGGTLLINGDEPLLKDIKADGFCIMTVSASNDGADFYAERIRVCNGGMIFDAVTPKGRYCDLALPAVGLHMVWAALFATAAGQRLGMEEAAIREGLSHYRAAAMRQQIRESAGVTVIEDCYNAAPESMKAALWVLKTVSRRRRVAVLGDMKELGESSEALHREVGRACVEAGVDLLVTVGEMGAWIAEGARESGMDAARIRVTGGIDTYAGTAEWLRGELAAGDGVLIKASRSMALEKLASLL